MSRTTRCLFALGLSVSLAAACGDDDDDGFGVGGSGGRAGGGGRGGTAGAAGAAGASGAAGAAGDAGSGGTGGSGTGGTGGSGTGGSGTGGTGGSGTGGSSVEEPPDGGADAAVDGGDEPITDGGVVVEPIACEDLDDALDDATSSANNQNVIIARIDFVGANAVVTFKAVNGDFNFAPPLQLCTGSELGDCDDGVQALEGSGEADGGVGNLLEGETVEFTTPLGSIVTAASGELALVNGQPGVNDPFVAAYVNWGGYVSLQAPNDGETLEEAAIDDDVWFAGDTIEVNGQTTIFANGDVVDENGFDVCTEVP